MPGATDIGRSLIASLPAAAAVIGAWIAYLVYRLNADRLYLDTFDKRRDALDEVFEAASERQREAALSPPAGAEMQDRPAQRRFWIAMKRAKPLFDLPVRRALDRLDEALRAFAILRADFAEARENDEHLPAMGRRHSDAVSAILAASDDVAKAAAPFIDLGARGLRPVAAIRRRLRR